MAALLRFVAFQAGWFACILGAARGRPMLGPLCAAGVIGLHLALTTRRWREAALVAAVAVIGFALDSAQVRFGVFAPLHADTDLRIVPLWFVAMWANFATLLTGPLGWLRGRYVLAGVLGAVGGPLSYEAGARIGAISWTTDWIVALSSIAMEWAFVTPLLVWMAKALPGGDRPVMEMGAVADVSKEARHA